MYLNYGGSDYNLKKNPKRKITKAKSSYLNKTVQCLFPHMSAITEAFILQLRL